MQYYRCKCGKVTMWGSDSPRPCQGCRECNTTLSGHPDDHKTPIPHDWTTETTLRDGVVVREITYCKRCHVRKSEAVPK